MTSPPESSTAQTPKTLPLISLNHGAGMNCVLDNLSGLLPWRVSSRLRDLHRATVFRRAMKVFLADPLQAVDRADGVLPLLVYGWGNTAWASQIDYLRACIKAVSTSRLPVLECGSGLSTIVLGAVCGRLGNTLWALEHLPEWAGRVGSALTSHGINGARVCIAPLRNDGGYTWYDVDAHCLPSQFGVVVCDGPPATTPGGRYGLVPAMRTRLPAGCVILLDDVERSEEDRIAHRWAVELPAELCMRGREKPFAELTVATR